MDEHSTLTSESIFESSVDWPTLCCVRIQTFKQKYEIQGYNWNRLFHHFNQQGHRVGSVSGCAKTHEKNENDMKHREGLLADLMYYSL